MINALHLHCFKMSFQVIRVIKILEYSRLRLCHIYWSTVVRLSFKRYLRMSWTAFITRVQMRHWNERAQSEQKHIISWFLASYCLPWASVEVLQQICAECCFLRLSPSQAPFSLTVCCLSASSSSPYRWMLAPKGSRITLVSFNNFVSNWNGWRPQAFKRIAS